MKTRDKVRKLQRQGASVADMRAILGVSDACVRNHLEAIANESAPDCRTSREDWAAGGGCRKCPTCVARRAVAEKLRPASELGRPR